jgi:hypothetical protein
LLDGSDICVRIAEPAVEPIILDDVAVQPIFVMSQDMRSYVEIGDVWQEVLVRAADNGGGLAIDGWARLPVLVRRPGS